MRIQNIKFRNFRSYGHIDQTIDFDDNGNLIGIVGESGSGKSIVKEVFEYVLFGKVRSRRKPEKYGNLKNLPNRRNKALKTSITIKSKDKVLLIERGMSPNIFKVTYNNKEIEDNKQIIIERLIGINSDIYQSFISFGQNDVLNFISLSKKAKDDIINKLFNYDYILSLSDKINTIAHVNNTEKNKKTIEKQLLTKSLNVNEKKLNVIKDNKISIDSNKIDSNKNTYLELTKNSEAFDKSLKILSNKNNEALKKYYDFKSNIDDLKSKISLYDSGVCPYCKNTLKDSENIKKDLEEKSNKAIKMFEDVEIELNTIKSRIKDNEANKTTLNKKINDILIDTKTIKNTIDLQKKIALLNQDDISKDINTFKDNINCIDKDIKQHTLKNIIYSDLNNILSLDGALKKEVLRKALPKINNLIEKYVKDLDFEYDIEVLDTLKVSISQYGAIVDNDDPSNGEIKRANLIIMFAFMTYSAFNSKINFMFLDELLEGLDLNSTYKMIKTLKHVSKDMNINLFLIVHKLQDLSQFDSVINVEKSFFSSLSTLKNNI